MLSPAVAASAAVPAPAARTISSAASGPVARLDPGNSPAFLDQRGHGGAQPQASAVALRIRQQRLRSHARLDRAFFGDVQRKIRRLGQVRLDRQGLGAADLPYAVAPGAALGGIGFELGARQVPGEPARPGERNAGHRRGKPAPFRHGADAQAEIGLRIAPAGIDPRKRIGRRDAAHPARIDDGHLRTRRSEVPGYRGADDPGADHDDLRSCHAESLRSQCS